MHADLFDDLFEDDESFVFEDDDTFDDGMEWSSSYPLLRAALAPEWRDASPEAIESLAASMGFDAEDMEFNLGKAFRDVGRVAAGIAPTVLPIAGTAIGTAFGGPLGGALGGTLGNLAGGAVANATRPAAAPQRRAPGAPRRPPARPSAATSLLSVLSRPEVLQALQAMAFGRAGAGRVPVAGTPVPPAAFANLIGMLASRAAEEHHALLDGTADGEAVPAYLLDGAGELAVDPTVPEARGERLLSLLDAAALEDLEWEFEYVDG